MRYATRTWTLAVLVAMGLMAPAGAAQAPAGLTRDLATACPAGVVPREVFDDVPRGAFDLAVDCLAWYEVTRGVGGGRYDAGGPVTRGQMASFLHRLVAYNLTPGQLPDHEGVSRFRDVPSASGHAAAINGLASPLMEELLGRRVISGYADGTYGPGEPITRAQMGTLLAHTFEGLVEAMGGEIADPGFCDFTDAAAIGSSHRVNVELVCAFGIATGRADGRYDPAAPVTRGQMAAFLMRLQDNLADEPFGAPGPHQMSVG